MRLAQRSGRPSAFWAGRNKQRAQKIPRRWSEAGHRLTLARVEPETQILPLLADYWTILKSGAFRAADYAWLHLGSRALAPIALLHYLLTGESQGNRPTPFFDPAFFAARRPQGGSPFAAFLRSPRGAPACAEFDEAWFVARHEEARSAASPWAFMTERGIADLLDPSPNVSLAFVAGAYRTRNKRLARTLMKVFHRRRGDGRTSCVLNRADLKANQAAFRAAIRLRALKETPAQRPWLVFVQTDGGHPARLHAPERRYDLMLNYYREPKEPARDAEYVFVQNGTKTTAIARLMEARPHIFDAYDYVLLLDDDIDLSAAQIADLFDLMRQNGLDLAQPALAEGSRRLLPGPVPESGIARVQKSQLRRDHDARFVAPRSGRERRLFPGWRQRLRRRCPDRRDGRQKIRPECRGGGPGRGAAPARHRPRRRRALSLSLREWR